ncbi:hypothetical protein NL108_014938 [Boleophthalmus pectinirostris]|nr:hypothetical protein NL108_014938 [Boleophthalmus pectinirostris]
MKIQAAFLLLFLMSASGFLKKHKNPLTPYGQFEKFVRVHIISTTMRANECFNMLKTLKINEEGQKCKKINTFIQATVQNVTDVCKKGKTVTVNRQTIHKSNGQFKITVCSLTKPGMFPKCKYDGKIKEAKIQIKCADMSLPVHFHGEADYDYE